MVVARHAYYAVGTHEKMSATIIIPIHNESVLLQKKIPQFVAWAHKNKIHKILLVENGSSDRSGRQVDHLARSYPALVRALHLPTASIGTAVRTGILAADGDIIILLSADWLDRRFVLRSIAMLTAPGTDIILGSKGMSESRDARPWYRRVLSWLLIFALHTLFAYKGKTINGIQAFRRTTVQPLIHQCRSSEIIESELVLRAHKAGLIIKEIPIVLREERPARIGIFRRARKVAWELLRLHKVLGYAKVQVMVHVDDGGHDPASVKALISLIEAGRVQSVSVMAGMPSTTVLAKFLLSLPASRRPRLFLHANLVEGFAVDTLSKGTAIADAAGEFHSMPVVVANALRGKLTVAAVQQELIAQLYALQKLGLRIVGIDSHMHMHALAPVATAVDLIARKHRLEVRDHSGFRAVTLRGKCKSWLLAQVARATQLRLTGQFRLPVSWRPQRPWRPFVMCSWEKVDMHTLPEDAVLVCHPRIGCDHKEVE